MKEGFFTRKCLAVLARQPKKSGCKNELAIRRCSTVVTGKPVKFSDAC